MTYVLSLIIYAWFCGVSMIGWMAIVPFYMVVFELALGRNLKKLLLTIPYFLIAGTELLLNHHTISGRLTQVKNFNLFTHLALNNNPLLIITHSIFSNLYDTLIPNHLSIYHEPLIITTNMLIIEIITVVALILALIPFFYRRFKALFFGLGMFIVNLIPTFTTIGMAWVLCDRYNYIGSILVACLIAWIYSRFSKYGNWVVAGIAILFMTYGYITVDRNCDYKTNHQFWLATVHQNPMSPRAHSEMGRILIAEQNYNMATMEFQNAIKCSPQYDVAWANLGIAYMSNKDWSHAVEAFEHCISLKSPLYMPYIEVGIIYLNSDMFDKAIVRFRQAFLRHPAHRLWKDIDNTLASTTIGVIPDKYLLKDLQKAWHIARRLNAKKKVR